MSAKLSIHIDGGTTVRFGFRVPEELREGATYTVRVVPRKYATATPFEVEHESDDEAIERGVLTPEMTSVVGAWRGAVMQIDMEFPSGDVTRLIEGKLYV